MGEKTGIEWTDATWNPWIGCQKVGPGCDHCYAEGVNARTGGSNWGPGAPRRRTSEHNWNEPLRWQRKAAEFEAENGRRRRVFCGSMMDVFDNAVPRAMTIEALTRLAECPGLDVQLLTKRVGNVATRIPADWVLGGWPRHIGLMVTVVNQKEADRDIMVLLRLKARFNIPWVGLSMEPLLGPVDLTKCSPGPGIVINSLTGLRSASDGSEWYPATVDWVIAGGESGSDARPSNPQWFRDLRDQCAGAGVPFFFKQWGEWVSISEVAGEGRRHTFDDHRSVRRIGKRRAGSTLDGVTHKQFPKALEGKVNA